MTRIMRDSTIPTDIPLEGCDIAAGYVNGSQSQWPANGWARFNGLSTVSIDVLGDEIGADVLDVERGNPTDANNGRDFSVTVNWVRKRYAAMPGVYPGVLYANRSTLTPMFNALYAAGFHVVTHFRLWIATLDGTKTVEDMTGVTGVQYAGEEQTGGHYDQSIVYDDNWKRKPVPVIPPKPVPVEYGLLVTGDVAGVVSRKVVSTDGGVNWR